MASSGCIGIDIGTTHATVGVIQNGKVCIIANDQGFRQTPCYISFIDNEEIVGTTAMNKVHTHTSQTIYHLKHLLGKKSPSTPSKEGAFTRDWTFALSSDSSVTLEHEGVSKTIDPETFCALMMKNLKTLAEDYTGLPVTHAVVTVPAYYTQEQTQLMTQAAESVGLQVLHVMTEPIAALVANGLDEVSSNNGPEIQLVFDMGGASHEISLVSVDQGLFRTLASIQGSSSSLMGGETFTKELMAHCLKAFHRQHPELSADVALTTRSTQRLMQACEAAKRALSQQTRAQIAVDSLVDGVDFSIKISRSRFEELIEVAVKTAVADIGSCLERAGGYGVEDVDQIFLVGGCAHMPLLQTTVEAYFGGKKVVLGADPDEAVATGATIEAGCLMDSVLLTKEKTNEADDDVSIPCVPLSLGIAAEDGSMVHIINREEVLPTSVHTEIFTTSVDAQNQIFIQVYEGERLLARDNTLLAEFCFAEFPTTEAGQVQIQVSFQVDRVGECQISAMEIETGKTVNWTIPQANPARLNPEQVQALVDEAEAKVEEDEAALDALEESQEEDDVESSSSAVTPASSTDVDMD